MSSVITMINKVFETVLNKFSEKVDKKKIKSLTCHGEIFLK